MISSLVIAILSTVSAAPAVVESPFGLVTALSNKSTYNDFVVYAKSDGTLWLGKSVDIPAQPLGTMDVEGRVQPFDTMSIYVANDGSLRVDNANTPADFTINSASHLQDSKGNIAMTGCPAGDSFQVFAGKADCGGRIDFALSAITDNDSPFTQKLKLEQNFCCLKGCFKCGGCHAHKRPHRCSNGCVSQHSKPHYASPDCGPRPGPHPHPRPEPSTTTHTVTTTHMPTTACESSTTHTTSSCESSKHTTWTSEPKPTTCESSKHTTWTSEHKPTTSTIVEPTTWSTIEPKPTTSAIIEPTTWTSEHPTTICTETSEHPTTICTETSEHPTTIWSETFVPVPTTTLTIHPGPSTTVEPVTSIPPVEPTTYTNYASCSDYGTLGPLDPTESTYTDYGTLGPLVPTETSYTNYATYTDYGTLGPLVPTESTDTDYGTLGPLVPTETSYTDYGTLGPLPVPTPEPTTYSPVEPTEYPTLCPGPDPTPAPQPEPTPDCGCTKNRTCYICEGLPCSNDFLCKECGTSPCGCTGPECPNCLSKRCLCPKEPECPKCHQSECNCPPPPCHKAPEPCHEEKHETCDKCGSHCPCDCIADKIACVKCGSHCPCDCIADKIACAKCHICPCACAKKLCPGKLCGGCNECK